MDEHDDDVEPEVEEDVAFEREAFPILDDEDEDVETEPDEDADDRDIDSDESEM